MTLTRDIRLTADQLIAAQDAVRRRRRQVASSISRAEANRAAGATVQHGTLDSHYRQLDQLSQLIDIFEVARVQMGRQLAAVIERGNDGSA